MLAASAVYIRLEDRETLQSNGRLGLLALVVISNLALVRLTYWLGELPYFVQNPNAASILPYIAPTALAPLIVEGATAPAEARPPVAGDIPRKPDARAGRVRGRFDALLADPRRVATERFTARRLRERAVTAEGTEAWWLRAQALWLHVEV